MKSWAKKHIRLLMFTVTMIVDVVAIYILNVSSGMVLFLWAISLVGALFSTKINEKLNGK